MNTISSLNTTNVDLSGLLTVLGQHLYSTPAVALRELVQNAHDSLTRRQMEEPVFTGGQIRIWGEAGRYIHIEDEGAGLTESEIHAYLATIGTGYTRLLRQKTDSDALIGLFGLGFVSAFVLAETVLVHTCSWQEPERGWLYRSSGGERYTVEPAAARPVGTRVTLELREQFLSLADTAELEALLQRYCVLLTHPVAVVYGDSTTVVNADLPPWRAVVVDEPPVRTLRRRLDFASRFEHQFEPLCTMDVVALDGNNTVGMLWVQDGASYATSDNRNLSVFVRGMLLDDDARDLLPMWAGFVGGVIESNTLTPTASREDLQRDEQYQQTQSILLESLIQGLSQLPRQQPETWRRILMRHNEALLAAAICDERLFALLADAVLIPTVQGDRRIQSLVSHGKVYVSLGSGGFEEMLFRAQQIPVARGDRYAVLPFLRRWCEARGYQLVQLGTAQGDRSLFLPAALPEDEFNWLAGLLLDRGEELVSASFAPAILPFVLVPDREAELKRRLEADDASKRISQAALSLARLHTAHTDGSVIARLYVNLNCPTIQNVLAARRQGAQDRAEAVTRILAAFKVSMAGDTDFAQRDLAGAFDAMTGAVQLLLAPVLSQKTVESAV